MTAFTVVYIQLTASQVGAKYLKRGLIVMKKTKKQRKKENGMNAFSIRACDKGYIKPCIFYRGTTYINKRNFGV